MSEWIDVEDRLPRGGHVVDVWKKAGHWAVGFYWYEDVKQFKRWDGSGVIDLSNVTHWREVSMSADINESQSDG